MLPIFPTSIATVEGPLNSTICLSGVRAARRWRWIWRNGGII